jgi:septation ring formation regulator EzrA
VPNKIKERIATAFMDLPHRAKAKRKIPFERKMLPDQHDKAKARLLKATHKEIATLERRQMVAPTDEIETKLSRMKEAIKTINAMTDNEAVPATWNTLDLGKED